MASTDSSIPGRVVLWLGFSMTVAVVAVVVAYAAFRHAGVKRNEIVLVDEDGRPRVRIAATTKGGTIALLDERGRARIELREINDLMELVMRSKEVEQYQDYALRLFVDGRGKAETGTAQRMGLTFRDVANEAHFHVETGEHGSALALEAKTGDVSLGTSTIDGTHLKLLYGTWGHSQRQEVSFKLGKSGTDVVQFSDDFEFNEHDIDLPKMPQLELPKMPD